MNVVKLKSHAGLSLAYDNVFEAYAFREQKRYIQRHLTKPRSMKLLSFISRIQELNAYLETFSPETEGQNFSPLPADEIMDIIYHSMPTVWKNKIIVQSFNHADSTIKEITDFFETRVGNLEPKEDRKKSSAAAKKTNKKCLKKR